MSRLLALYIICNLVLVICNFAYAEEGYLYDSQGKRDPFVPLIGLSATTRIVESLEDIMNIEDVNLQGIASDSSGEKVVILNGEMIKEGETIGHLTVKKILRNEIILAIDGVDYRLNIYQENVNEIMKKGG